METLLILCFDVLDGCDDCDDCDGGDCGGDDTLRGVVVADSVGEGVVVGGDFCDNASILVDSIDDVVFIISDLEVVFGKKVVVLLLLIEVLLLLLMWSVVLIVLLQSVVALCTVLNPDVTSTPW